MRKYFVLLCIFAASHNSFAESVYSFDPKKDTAITAVSAGLAVSALFFGLSVDGAPRDVILQKSGINAFDRWLVYEYNKPLDIAGYVAVYGLIGLPFVSLAGNFHDASAWATYGIMYAQSLLLVFGTCEILKNAVLRYRPYCYTGGISPGQHNDFYKSFPSMHTAFAFMAAGFLTSTFFSEYPDSRWRLPLSAASYSVAAGIGVSRIFSGSHFISDVLTGAVIGSIYGYLIPMLHLRKKTNNVRFVLLPNGFTVAYAF